MRLWRNWQTHGKILKKEKSPLYEKSTLKNWLNSADDTGNRRASEAISELIERVETT